MAKKKESNRAALRRLHKARDVRLLRKLPPSTVREHIAGREPKLRVAWWYEKTFGLPMGGWFSKASKKWLEES